MADLHDVVRAAARRSPLEWSVQGNRIRVEFGESGRGQVVSMAVTNDEVRLSSVVLDSREVTRSTKRWRELARHAWRRNTQKQMVCFTFDDRDRLIGQILQPLDMLDVEELVLYVNTLARECDEYEYRLSGEDRF